MEKIYYEITNTKGNIPIAIFYHYKAPIQSVKAHWHRALELTLNLEGTVDFYNGNQFETLHENEVSISNSGEIHYSIPHFDCYEDKIVGITLQINYDFLKSLIPDLEETYFKINNPNIQTSITNNILQICKLYDSNNNNKYIKIFLQLLTIIDLLYENCRTKYKNKATKKTKEILNYIHLNYNHDIHLYQVADYFGYSREYFSRMFKQEIGLSFKQYLDNYRIDKSIQLLINSNQTILEIAYATGFTNENQFIQTFKKYYHLTPGNFRKLLFEDK